MLCNLTGYLQLGVTRSEVAISTFLLNSTTSLVFSTTPETIHIRAELDTQSFVLDMPSRSLTAPGIAPSRTKREFFAQLNLTEGYEADENIFKLMLVCH